MTKKDEVQDLGAGMGGLGALIPKILDLFKQHLGKSKETASGTTELGGAYPKEKFSPSPFSKTPGYKGARGASDTGAMKPMGKGLGATMRVGKEASPFAAILPALLEMFAGISPIPLGIATSTAFASPKEKELGKELMSGKAGKIDQAPTPAFGQKEQLLDLLKQAAASPEGLRGAIQSFRLGDPTFLKGGGYSQDLALLSNMLEKAEPKGTDIGQTLANATGGTFTEKGQKKMKRKKASTPKEKVEKSSKVHEDPDFSLVLDE